MPNTVLVRKLWLVHDLFQHFAGKSGNDRRGSTDYPVKPGNDRGGSTDYPVKPGNDTEKGHELYGYQSNGGGRTTSEGREGKTRD